MSGRFRRVSWPLFVPLVPFFVAVLASPSVAQEGSDGEAPETAEAEYPRFTFDGQVRLRGEPDGRTSGVDPDFAVLSRIRVGARAVLQDWISAYVQIQDARAWGSELNTLTDASADALDLHQGYADLGSGAAFTARLGRQEMKLGDERLVGAVDWSNTGRPFDGARMFGESGGYYWTAFWMNIAERDSLLAIGLHPQLNQGVNDDGWLIGGFASKTYGDVNTELTFVIDREAITRESYTANLRLHGRTAGFLYEGAGAYQFGPDRSAWLASAKLGYGWSRVTVAGQLDWLSGDDDTTDVETKAFNTLYATNHKFYGYMDYFLALPLQLDGAGLVDAILRGSWAASPSTTVRFDLHRFWTAEERAGERELGTELDLVGAWKIAAPANLQAGFGVFVPEDLITGLLPAFENGDETTWWGFVQLTLNWP
jgi:hypothetical protein